MEALVSKIDSVLTSGGRVAVQTYTRTTIYTPKHRGWFFVKNGSLFVKHGRQNLKLSIGDTLLVGIQFAMVR